MLELFLKNKFKVCRKILTFILLNLCDQNILRKYEKILRYFKINLQKLFIKFFLSQETVALINVFSLVELILIVKALAGIPVTVPSNAFYQGLWGQSLPVFLCTLCVFVTDCTNVLTLSFSRLHEHVVR